MTDMRTRPVVAGFDTSPSAATALEAAAAEAAERGVGLVIVHAYAWPILYASLTNVPYRPEDWSPSPGTVRLVETAAGRVGARHPGLEMRVAVRAGSGGDVLVDASTEASLVVLGARGSAGIAGMLTGSVVSQVAAQAHCPVLVVRGASPGPATGGEVCVGLDGSPGSLAALRYAIVWAGARGAAVRVLSAIDADATDRPGFGALTPGQLRQRRWIEAAGVAPASVLAGVVRRSAPDALLGASRTARLVVVGAPDEPRSLGPVPRTLVRRASCPVVIVHGWAGAARADPARENRAVVPT